MIESITSKVGKNICKKVKQVKLKIKKLEKYLIITTEISRNKISDCVNGPVASSILRKDISNYKKSEVNITINEHNIYCDRSDRVPEGVCILANYDLICAPINLD